MGLLGMGIALPGESVSTHELLELLYARFGIDMKRQGRALAARLGVNARYVCRDFKQPRESPRAQDSNAYLAARAVSAALDEAGLVADDLVYLIAHTATPGRLLPPNVAEVAELLGYRGPYAELRQACTGFANALVMAFGLLHRSEGGPVAIVGSETGSVFFDPRRVRDDSAQFVNFLQMGDAAGACVLVPTSRQPAAQIRKVYYGHVGNGRTPAFSMRSVAASEETAADRFLEFEHDYRSVFEHGPQLLRRAIEAAADTGIDPQTTRYFVPHQVNGLIARHLAAHLEVAEHRIFVNADRLGNTGSAAIWLALAELRARLRKGDSVCVLGVEATKYMYGGFEYLHP